MTPQRPTHSTARDGEPSWKPDALQWWRTIPLGLTFIAIAISAEVVLYRSKKEGGFDIHLTNTELSRGKQFLKSFGPAIIFTPLSLWFTSAYDAVKLLQPYVDMRRNGDGVPASQSVLVDYIAKGPSSAYLESFKKRHWTVFILSFCAIYSGVFAALAGSYFQITSASQPMSVTVNVTGKVGLGYENLLNKFIPYISASGSLDNALRYGALNLPYLFDGSDSMWAVPSFTLAHTGAPVQGANVTTRLSAVAVQVRCAAPKTNMTGITDGNYNLVGTLPNNCTAKSWAPSPGNNSWYGWAAYAPLECVKGINPNETIRGDPGEFFYPAILSFYKNESAYSMVVCYSALTEHDTEARLGFGGKTYGINGVIDNGVVRSLGYGPNGLNFGGGACSVFIGLGDGIKWALSDAIVQHAGYTGVLGAGISTSLQDRHLSDGNLATAIAQKVYTLYQALIAPSTVVIGPEFQQNATYEMPTFRLVANEPVAHALTVLCALTGVVLIVLFYYYHMRTKDIRLSAEPSGIATIAALLSRSRFPAAANLQPSDDFETIRDKLQNYRFKLQDDGGIDGVEEEKV